jgi:hypothetical protein
MTAGDELRHELRADRSGSAGDEDSHAISPVSVLTMRPTIAAGHARRTGDIAGVRKRTNTLFNACRISYGHGVHQ